MSLVDSFGFYTYLWFCPYDSQAFRCEKMIFVIFRLYLTRGVFFPFTIICAKKGVEHKTTY